MADADEVGIQSLVPIREFDSDAQCKKCDTKKDEDVGDGKPLGVSVRWTLTSSAIRVNGVLANLPENIEILVCKCQRCGFEFLMNTSDAEERIEAAKKAAEEERERQEAKKEAAEPPPVRFKGHASRAVKK